MTTWEEWLNSLASPLATKNPQNARPSLGPSRHAKRIARHRDDHRLIGSSFRRRKVGRGERTPLEARTRKQEIEPRHGGGERSERPQEAVGPEESIGDGVRERRHPGSEKHAPQARVRRGAG